jgi:hypothetical protein
MVAIVRIASKNVSHALRIMGQSALVFHVRGVLTRDANRCVSYFPKVELIAPD